MDLIVNPFRGNMSVGMKCQCVHSSPWTGNDACCRCSAVRLLRKGRAALAIAPGERPAARTAPSQAAIRPIARTQRDERWRFMTACLLDFAKQCPVDWLAYGS